MQTLNVLLVEDQDSDHSVAYIALDSLVDMPSIVFERNRQPVVPERPLLSRGVLLLGGASHLLVREAN